MRDGLPNTNSHKTLKITYIIDYSGFELFTHLLEQSKSSPGDCITRASPHHRNLVGGGGGGHTYFNSSLFISDVFKVSSFREGTPVGQLTLCCIRSLLSMCFTCVPERLTKSMSAYPTYSHH